MKIQKKISSFNLIISGLVLLLGACVIFTLILGQFRRMDFISIQNRIRPIIEELKNGTEISDIELRRGQALKKITNDEVKYEEVYFKEEFRPHENITQEDVEGIEEYLRPPLSPHFITLYLDTQINNQWFRIEQEARAPVRKDFFIQLGIAIAVTFFGLYLLLNLGNNYFFRQILKPFNLIISKIEKFNIQDERRVLPVKTTIDEFALLDNKANLLMEYANSEYQRLKEFSENASHELQTPLAIVRSKLDLLAQSENLSEKDFERIFMAQAAVQNMSKLNETLLLINKIDNKEYELKETVELRPIIEKISGQLEEIMLLKNILITKDLEDFKVQNNKYLIELLVSNLLSNAIKHNVSNGFIFISLFDGKLIVKNSGEKIDGVVEDLFLRFRKGKQSNNSTGLGLAIVKKICDVSNYEVVYENIKSEHEIRIIF